MSCWVLEFRSNYSNKAVIWLLILDVLDSDEVENFLTECVLMKKTNHSNVLGLLGVCLDTETGLPCIVLPFMANGDLKRFLYNKRITSGAVLTNPEVNK